jgi:hypothetical protein
MEIIEIIVAAPEPLGSPSLRPLRSSFHLEVIA